MRQFLKYEFKFNWKQFVFSFSLIILSFILMTIFALFVKNIEDPGPILGIVYSNIVILIGGSMGVGAVFFVINLIRSFYNSIFSDEGYLTLSFPKTTDSLLVSKIIANFIWVISFVISFVIGLTILYFGLGGTTNVLFEMFTFIFDLFEGYYITVPFHIINGIVDILASFVMLLLAFSIINVGNIRRAKVFLGILFFVIMSYCLSLLDTISSFLAFGFAINEMGELVFTYGSAFGNIFLDSGATAYLFNFTTFIIHIGVVIGGYILLRHLIKNKLEME